MRADARAVVEAGPDGKPCYRTLRSAAPLLLRPTANGLHVVGGAAGPLGGDDVSLEMVVGSGAALVVRTLAASVALRGPVDRQAGNRGSADLCRREGVSEQPHSRFTVSASVGAGASLRWLPEPGVAASGCRHVTLSRLDLSAGATVIWRDEVVMGRHSEQTGAWACSLDVDLAGEPLLRHCMSVGPGAPAWDGPAVVGRARAVGSILVVGSPGGLALEGTPGRWPPPRPRAGPGGQACSDRVAVLSLPGPGLLVSAMAPTALSLRRLLHGALEHGLGD